MKKWFILSTVLLVLLGVGIWVSGRGYLVVTLPTNTSSYDLTSQKVGAKTSTTKSTGATSKKLLARGEYEVSTATSNGQSFFEIVHVGGLFKTTSVTATLHAKNSYSFIGDNPSSCMYLIEGQLASIACGDSFDQLKIHQAAAADIPTITVKPASPLTGYIEGVVQTPSGSVALVRDQENDKHVLYNLVKSGTANKSYTITGVSGGEPYKLIAYKQGFIAYAQDGSKFLVFSALGQKPTTLTPEKPKGNNLTFTKLIVHGDTVAAIYTSNPDQADDTGGDIDGAKAHSEEFNEETGTDKKTTSEVVAKISGDQYSHITLKDPASGIGFCGSNLLCTFDNGTVTVYDISSGVAKQSYEISAIDRVFYQPEGILLARNSSILAFNTKTRQGYTSLSLSEDRSICGLTQAPTGYLICTEDGGGARQAILVDQTKDGGDDIDAKISKLRRTDGVASVSIYGNYIFVTPEVGDDIYNPEDRAFERDQTQINQTNAAIRKQINELGIDQKKYTVTFTIR